MLNENIIILKKLYKRRTHILVITLCTAVISFAFSFFITPQYKSTAFIYPANLGIYSEESQTEQLLQFINSNEIRLYLLKKYNLCAHYKIDTTKKTYLFAFDGVYDKKININKTKYESIELKIEDCDPDTAVLLLNGIVEATNWLIENEHRKKYMETVKNAEIYLKFKKHEVDSTQKILTQLSEKMGLINISIQLKEAAKNQYKLWASGGKNVELSNLMDNIKKLGVEQGRLAIYFDDQLRGWAWANNDYQKKLSEYYYKTSFTVMASKPTRPVIASWPKRSVILPISCAAVFILSCIYFVFIDKIKLAYEQIASEK